MHAEFGITFVHVTHDQEEAMTMADVIAVMNRGRIEQAGSARDLYDTPKTAFVANFLGQSNLVDATVTGTDGEWTVVETHDGVKLKAPTDRVAATTGRLAVGVRPEKVWIWDRIEEADDGVRENKLTARVITSAFLGVSMEYHVLTAAGDELIVTVQNNRRNASPPYENGTEVELSWEPEHTSSWPWATMSDEPRSDLRASGPPSPAEIESRLERLLFERARWTAGASSAAALARSR